MTVLRTATDVRDYALRHWREIVPELLVAQVQVGPAPDPALIQVELPAGGGPVRRLLFVPAASGEPRLLQALLPRLRQLGNAPGTWAGLLVPHMGAAGMRLCREAGVGYLDCCGNASLRFNQVLVQISGNRNRFAQRKRIRTLFHDKATIPLRVLLEQPGSWLTTREIAERGRLSIGWVSQILQQLHTAGYVERKRGGGTRLLHPLRLLRDWIREYSFEQNEIYPFRPRQGGAADTLERLAALGPPWTDGYALTLEAAVRTLAGRGRPRAVHLYLPELGRDPGDALKTWPQLLGLRPAGQGATCFLVRPAYRHGVLFGAQQHRGLRLVSDLQLFLDLHHYPLPGRERAEAAVASRLPFGVR